MWWNSLVDIPNLFKQLFFSMKNTMVGINKDKLNNQNLKKKWNKTI